jgi:hypothetical protein
MMRQVDGMQSSVVATLLILGAAVLGVTQTRAQSSRLPRTAWGTPDFQGATWNFATMTPLERPKGVTKPQLDEAEAAALEKQTAAERTANTNNGYDWWDDGAAHLDRRRTSLITDPPDGHLPPIRPDAPTRLRTRELPDGPEELPLNTRCIWWQNAAPPMLPSPYNNNVQFVQTRQFVVISNENIHDARIVPVDGRPHGTLRRWYGDSVGRWQGDTLVVDTANFTSKTTVNGSDENLHVVERFRFIDANTLDYQFTVDDASVWPRQWSGSLPMHRTEQPVYEFGCHEGNALMMENILRSARYVEKQ